MTFPAKSGSISGIGRHGVVQIAQKAGEMERFFQLARNVHALRKNVFSPWTSGPIFGENSTGAGQIPGRMDAKGEFSEKSAEKKGIFPQIPLAKRKKEWYNTPVIR